MDGWPVFRANEPYRHRPGAAVVALRILGIPFLRAALHIPRSRFSARRAKECRGRRRMPAQGRALSTQELAGAMRLPGGPTTAFACGPLLRFVEAGMKKKRNRGDSGNEPDCSLLRSSGRILNTPGDATRKGGAGARPVLRLDTGRQAYRHSCSVEAQNPERTGVLCRVQCIEMSV